MKRALAVLLVFVGFSAFGIGTFTGKWETKIQLLPSPISLTANTLTLNYTDFGWTFGAVMSITGTTNTFDLTAKGAFGPFNVDGAMNFDFTPRYLGAKLVTQMELAGLSLGLEAYHGTKYIKSTECQTPASSLKYVLSGTIDPFSVKLTFLDCCSGTAFSSALITLKNIGLCCGIALTAELSFLKSGFDYVKFTGINIPLCCGVSLDVAVTFKTDSKSVAITPKFAGLGEACFEVFGNPKLSGSTWTGIEITGWKINCTIAGCNKVLFATGFLGSREGKLCGKDSTYTYVIIEKDSNCGSGYTDYGIISYWGLDATFAKGLGFYAPYLTVVNQIVYLVAEYETMQLSFCGVGCCGGNYSVAIKLYWANFWTVTLNPPVTFTPVTPTLFGLSRIAFTASIPVMSNLSASVDFSYTLLSGATSLTFGWVFSF